MDTALITGMLEIKVLPEKKVEKDVKQLSTESFSGVFQNSLKNKEVKSKEVKTEEVENKDVENKIDQKENKDVEKTDVEESKDKKRKKDVKKEDSKDEAISNEFVKILRIEDVEEEISIKQEDVNLVEMNPEDRLNGLLEKLDVEQNKNFEIKDASGKVIEVGPQLVETEKIKLNINDVENKFKDILKNKVVDKKDVDGEFNLSKLEEMLNEKVDNIEDVSVSIKDTNTIEELDISKMKFNSRLTKEDVNELENGSGTDKVVDNFGKNNSDLENGSLNKKDADDKSGEKESKLKIKDFSKKESNSFLDRIMNETDVKLESKFEIKEVSNIQKFENLNVEQTDILDQVTEKLEVSLFDNKSEMVIKLKPNDLGKVTVKISIENGVMNAKFLADSIKVKETLESSLNNLKESLKDQGLNVQNLSVSVDSGRSQNQNFEQNNLVYFKDRKDYHVEELTGLEETYYEPAVSETISNTRSWMGSTVSFFA